MMDTSTDTKRARLLNLIGGGNGHVEPWIERVTIRRPGEPDTAAFVLHLPSTGNAGRDILVFAHDGSIGLCHSLILALKTGATPRDPEMTDDEVEARNAAMIDTIPPPEDRGRIIGDLSELK